MSTKIRKLAMQFRIRNTKYFLKKRTGQAALYAKYTQHTNALLGFEVVELKVSDLGKTLDFGELCLVEVYPPADSPNVKHFESGQEVEAWTAFQNLIDKQASRH